MKNEFTQNEERLISDLRLARNSAELMKMLEQISTYVDAQITNLVADGQNSKAVAKRELAGRAYRSAAELIEIEDRFKDSRTFSKTLRMTADYWYDKAKSRPDNLDNIRSEAFQFRDSQDYEKAIERFAVLVEFNPKDFESWLEKGNCLFYLNNFKEAVACYDKCTGESEDEIHVHAICNKGLALNNLGMYEEALQNLNKALEMAKRIGNTLIMEFAKVGAGQSYIELGKYDKAEYALLGALEQNDESIESMTLLSSLYNRKFDYVKAAQYAEKVVRKEPERTGVKAGLAEFLLASGEYERREKLIDEVLAEAPDEYGYPMRLIKICSLYFRKKNDEANRAALDLIEYSYSISNNLPHNWHYGGLKNMVNISEVSDQIKSVLLSFITIAETNDELVKREELSQLPAKIRLTKGKLRSFLDANEGPIAFKKGLWPKIIIKNSSKPQPHRPGWYSWEIFLSPIEALTKVDSVTYTLHKTFKDPEIKITNRQDGFRLKSEGWGEFRVKVQIHYKDGDRRETVTKYHWLALGPTPLDDD